MASMHTIKESILLCGEAGITCWLWGIHGIGKSSIVAQVATDNHMGCIDFRCSQIEAADLRGLPDRIDGRTQFLPPADMPKGDLSYDQVLEIMLETCAPEITGSNLQERFTKLQEFCTTDHNVHRLYRQTWKRMQPRFQRGILFADELNRAADDVLQAAFQLVLSGEIGQYVLPPGWFVVAAGNYNEGYLTSGFSDPAFLDRFCHIDFPRGDATLEDWVLWMTKKHGELASDIIEFTTSNVDHLNGKIDADRGFTVAPSPRSWDAVGRVLKAYASGKYSKEARMLVIQGLVGMEIGNTFESYSCPVKPKMLLERGVKAMIPELTKLERGPLLGLMWGVISVVGPRLAEDKIAETCLDFAEWMAGHQTDRDLVVSFCRSLLTTGCDPSMVKLRTSVLSNPGLAAILTSIKTPSGPMSFMDRINARPKLQKMLADVSWGKTSI